MHRKISKSCDVAVIGGGPGGLSAAIAAARQGARVILAERSAALGGAAASGLGILGFIDRAGNKALGGLAQEYFDRLAQTGGAAGHYRCPVHNSISPLSPDAFKVLAVELCREAGVELLFGCELTDAAVENGRVVRANLFGKCTDVELTASVFVDGTGDGDLAYLAGAEYVTGQDGTGINQPSTLVFTVTGYDLERFFRFIEEHPEEAGIKEDYAQGYDLEFFRNTPGHCFIGLTEMVKRAKANGDFDVPRNQFIYIRSPQENLLTINTVRVTNIDGSDLLQLSAGIEEGYRQVGVLVRFMRKYMPGFEHVTLSQISPSLGVRESRHFAGVKRLTAKEMHAYRQDEDTIALCGYNVDIHCGTAEHIDLTPVERAFGIPYGCIVPKAVDGLLLSGRTISVDTTVFAAARVMGPVMAMGEAAGIAAAICAKEKIQPRHVDVAAVRAVLLENGGILRI